MDNQTAYLAGSDENRIAFELLISKFNNFAKDKFGDYVFKKFNYIDFIKQTAIQSAFNLPNELDEVFIDERTAPFILLSDLPFVKKAENYLRTISKNLGASQVDYEGIKKFYSKWAIQEKEKEKRYFALSTINVLERNANKNNFLKYILYGLILAFDDGLKSTEKAISQWDKSLDILSNTKMNKEVLNEFNYLIKLLSGLTLLKNNDTEEALKNFDEAKSFKSFSSNANFYNALVYQKQENSEDALKLLENVFHFDRERFEYAIKRSNLNLFTFFVRNAFLYKIFNYHDFADIMDEIGLLLHSYFPHESSSYNAILQFENLLKETDLTQFYSDNINKQLEFLTDFYRQYNSNKNALVLSASGIVVNKIEEIKKELLQNIKAHYQEWVKSETEIFDQEINDLNGEIKYYTEQYNSNKEKAENERKKKLEEIEKNYKNAITALEEKISDLETSKDYDPAESFKNGVVLSLILSVLVFIVGGFAGDIFSGSDINANFSQMVGKFIVSGIKWAGISMVLGTLISIFSSANSLMEKANQKQKLVKKISYLKNVKEKETEQLKHQIQKRINAYEKNKNDLIKDLQERIEGAQEAKAAKYEELQAEANEEVEKYKELLGIL